MCYNEKNSEICICFVFAFFGSGANTGQKVEYIKIPGLERILNDPRNKLLVINFWATWCAPCVSEIPVFEKTAKSI